MLRVQLQITTFSFLFVLRPSITQPATQEPDQCDEESLLLEGAAGVHTSFL